MSLGNSLPRHRSMSEKTYKLKCSQDLRQWLVSFVSDTDVGHDTNLTIDWGGDVKRKEIKNYGHEGAETRKGVDLQNRKFNRVVDGKREQCPLLPTQIVHW